MKQKRMILIMPMPILMPTVINYRNQECETTMNNVKAWATHAAGLKPKALYSLTESAPLQVQHITTAPTPLQVQFATTAPTPLDVQHAATEPTPLQLQHATTEPTPLQVQHATTAPPPIRKQAMPIHFPAIIIKAF